MENPKYEICYDTFNPTTNTFTTNVMATAPTFEKAVELVDYYGSEEWNTEFYIRCDKHKQSSNIE